MHPLCKLLPAAALTLFASATAADAVVEPRVLDVEQLLEVIEVIDVTAEKSIDESIDESAGEALDPEVTAILEEAILEDGEAAPEQEE